DKDYPKAIHYAFENDGKQIEYTLCMKKIIENFGFNDKYSESYNMQVNQIKKYLESGENE
ncbi:hypothetical protein, partial [Listeria innocua]|uniref:hypothetical protein n=1 Tax=Listeria innocua TaxID=1642 RepID=UPI001C8A563A